MFGKSFASPKRHGFPAGRGDFDRRAYRGQPSNSTLTDGKFDVGGNAPDGTDYGVDQYLIELAVWHPGNKLVNLWLLGGWYPALTPRFHLTDAEGESRQQFQGTETIQRWVRALMGTILTGRPRGQDLAKVPYLPRPLPPVGPQQPEREEVVQRLRKGRSREHRDSTVALIVAELFFFCFRVSSFLCNTSSGSPSCPLQPLISHAHRRRCERLREKMVCGSHPTREKKNRGEATDQPPTVKVNVKMTSVGESSSPRP